MISLPRFAFHLSLAVSVAAFAVADSPSAPAFDEAAETERPIRPADREHWSFRPLERPEVPGAEDLDGDDDSWALNPIDRFVLARWKEHGLRPLPRATRGALIRRLTFDLTGLPPSPEAVEEFLADESPGAYERLVGRLLASPAYGERWGQHWLDLARFAETDGFEHDHVRPNAWRYRDWVIGALNEDMTYDEFVRLQLAGDELRPGDPDAAVATGFAICGPDMPDINSQVERRHVVLNDVTSTVGSVFLGLQFHCAECHDHKYDPVSQADFYRLRAFFDNVVLFRDLPIPTAAALERESRRRAQLEAEREELEERLRELETLAKQRDLTGEERQSSRETEKALESLKEGEKKRKSSLPHGRVLKESDRPRKPSHLMVRGDYRSAGPRVRPAFPRIANLAGEIPTIPESSSDGSSEERPSGLRPALADWLTRPGHPLSTRVIVNRVWQHHFAAGLVRTPSNFGTVGEAPSHPLLLDWLATEISRLGWSLKSLHRLIVCSATYRQASHPSTAVDDGAECRERWRRAAELDPENRWLARQNRRRLEAETIRDTLLAVSGRLSQRTGGRGIMAPLPQEIRKTVRKDHWKVAPNVEDHHRRSVYLFVRRNLRYPFFDVFDRPDTNASCARRSRTTIAPQALALLNSELSLEAARRFAGLLLRETAGAPGPTVRLAYRRALGREPTEIERREGESFLEELARRLRIDKPDRADLALPTPFDGSTDPHAAAALTSFCLALFNLNEFLYVD